MHIKLRTGKSLDSSQYAISCGFPSKGGTRRKNKRIGECHHVGETGRKVHQIFVHPELTDTLELGNVVLHELLHAVLPAGAGHRKPFSRAAKAIGLDGKPTATVLGEAMKPVVEEWVKQIGPYPHEALTGEWGRKQETRLLKVMCPLCGYIIRVTAKWLDEAGAPFCPQCMVQMQEAGTGEEASDPLYPVDQIIRYKVKSIDPKVKGFDPRWEIQCTRTAKNTQGNWTLIDYGPPLLTVGDSEQKMAVLGVPTPRITPAESRPDAISLLEALRDGNLTYQELEADDDAPELELDEEEDEQEPSDRFFFQDEFEETGDYEDQVLTEEEMEEYERESDLREGR